MFKKNSPTSKAWGRLKRNKPALLGMGWIVCIVIFAILGYKITPDSTPNCDNQMVRIKLQSPGFSTQVLQLKSDLENLAEFEQKTSIIMKI